jgi:nitrile hydratase beta subunit
MNGVHDMGGMHGFGPVEAEPNEPVFHTEWEQRVFALTLAMGAWRRWNIDKSRYTREQMPPVAYLAATYYERWLWGLQKLLVETGLVTATEMARPATLASARRGEPQPGVLRAADVARALRNRRATRRDDPVPPRFKVGDRVIARNLNPLGHTRLPRYVRGHHGVVDRDHGVFVFADTNALGQGEKPQHVYSVRFSGRELWGPMAPAHDHVYVDLWDDHLDAG